MATDSKGSDETSNFICCICDKKNVTTEAEYYCVECQDYYCTLCTDLHKLFPSTVGLHQFMDKASFSTGSTQTKLPSFPVERCATHSAKLLDMYCADHDEIACATCVALNHRKCQSINSVPDEIDNLYEVSAANETKRQLLIAKANMESLKSKKEHIVTELDRSKEEVAQSIEQFRREIEAALETLESESVKYLIEVHTKIRASLEEEIKLTQTCIDNLQTSLEKLSKSFGNRAQEFVSVKLGKKHIIESNESERALAKETYPEIVVASNAKINVLLNELKSFDLVSAPAIKKAQTSFCKVKNKRMVNIRQANDTTCCIYGLCFTDSGVLLLTDNTNKKLKRVDVSSELVKDHLDLEAAPYVVCQTGKNEVAVSFHSNIIQFVSLGDKMTPTKRLSFENPCRGITYKDDKLFVSDGLSSLYIHDMKNSNIKKITVDQVGNAIFSSTRRICLSSGGDLIYIADMNKGVVTLDLDGDYQSTFTDPGAAQPCGVCNDGKGNMFVCGWGEADIVMINEKTKKRLAVIGKGTDIRSICFNSRQNKLFAFQNNSNNIDIYELQ